MIALFQLDVCPNGQAAEIRRNKDGSGAAQFGKVCAGCPLRAQCTKATGGRSFKVGRHERRLAEARQRQTDPDWLADYRATRPKLERKFAHLMRRRHGGRRARARGQTKIPADFALLAAAPNLARLGILWRHRHHGRILGGGHRLSPRRPPRPV